MKRAAILIAAMMILGTRLAGADPRLALETCTLHPQAPTAAVLGVERQMMDTYAINVDMTGGTRLRDIYAIYRNGQWIGEGVVVYVGPRYSLITLRQRDLELRAGDRVERAGHSAVYRRSEWKPSSEVLVVRERDTRSSIGSPSGSTSFSGPTTFSGQTTFSGATTFSGQTSFYGQNAFNGQTTFSGTTSFPGSTTFQGATTFPGPTSFGGGTTFTGQTSMSIPRF